MTDTPPADVEHERDALLARVEAVRHLHSGPRTERHGSGCVQCGIVWPCPTAAALEGMGVTGMVTVRLSDLDQVMNRAACIDGWQQFADACDRIRTALNGGNRD